MVAVPVLEMDQLLELVNHYAHAARRAAENEERGYLPLATVLAEADLDDPGLPDPGTAALQEVTGEAYGVFARVHAGEDVTGDVNALLGRAGPTPRLGADGAVVWQVDREDQVLRAAVAVSLLDWIHARGADRLGLCQGIQCADAFADASGAGRRKYCSPGCLNRHKVAAFRRRAAERSAATGVASDVKG